MTDYTDAEVPSVTLADGRQFIPIRDVLEDPEIDAFVKRYSNYWRFDLKRLGYVSPMPDEAQ